MARSNNDSELSQREYREEREKRNDAKREYRLFPWCQKETFRRKRERSNMLIQLHPCYGQGHMEKLHINSISETLYSPFYSHWQEEPYNK